MAFRPTAPAKSTPSTPNASNSKFTSDPGAVTAPAGSSGEAVRFDGAMEESAKESVVPLTPDTTVVIEGCPEPVTVSTLEASIAPWAPLRRGKWTREEEEFADHLIQEFQKGIINIKESTTMRTYLAQELHCPAMRISKKYHGNASMGLQMYTMMSTARRAHPDTALMVERMKARRQYFRMQFLIKLYQSSLKNRPQREKPEAPVHHFSVVMPDPMHAPPSSAGPYGSAFSTQASPTYVYNSQQESEAERSGRMVTRGVSSRQSTALPSPTGQSGGSAAPAMMPFATSQGITFMAPMGGTGTPMSVFPMKTEGGFTMMAPFPMASPDGGFPMIPMAVSGANVPGMDGSVSSSVMYIPVMAPGQLAGMPGTPFCFPSGFPMQGMMPVGGDLSSNPTARLCAQATQPVHFGVSYSMPTPTPTLPPAPSSVSAPSTPTGPGSVYTPRPQPPVETSFVVPQQQAVMAAPVPASRPMAPSSSDAIPTSSVPTLTDASLLMSMSSE